MKHLITSLMIGLMLSICINLRGQELSRQVEASGGDYFQNGSAQLSWTLGETAIETYSTALLELTQGFQQSLLSATALDANPGLPTVKVFPNPTSMQLNVAGLPVETSWDIRLYDATGRLISETASQNQVQLSLDCSDLATGMYQLHISSPNQPFQSFSILKLN